MRCLWNSWGTCKALMLGTCLVVATASPGEAQQSRGAILGAAHSPDGSPLGGVEVVATSSSLQGSRTVTTNGRGEFQLLLLPIGDYELAFRLVGTRAVRVTGIRVQLGKTESILPVVMSPVTVQLDPLVVTAARATIDPRSSALSYQLDSATLADIPNERDYQRALAILPQANESYYGDAVNIGGSTGSENMLFVDGINVTEGNGHRRGIRLPYNFIRSVQVQQGGYEAQYGRALGGIANAVTYAGGNEFEASIFGFYTNDALAATPVVPDESSVFPITGFSTYDFGARVSGPIVRDRLWFSAAYNPYFEQSDKTIGSLGTFRDKRTEHRYAGKLTWLIAPTSQLEFTVLGDPSTHSQVQNPRVPGFTLLNADPVLFDAPINSNFGSLRFTQELGSLALLDISFGYSRTAADAKAATSRGATDAHYEDFEIGAISGGVALQTEETWTRATFSAKSTFFLGAHSVTAGIEYEDNGIDTKGDGVNITFFDDPSDGPTWITDEQRWEGKVGTRIPTVFAQDEWRITDRFTVNAGLRWSAQRMIGNADTVAQVLGNEWQPRLGTTLLLGDEMQHRLYAGYGRYYQQNPLANPALWYLDYTQILQLYFDDPRDPASDAVAELDLSTTEGDIPKQEGMRMDYFDEISLGYERLMGGGFKVGVRGLYRTLQTAWGLGFDENAGEVVLGNIGKGLLDFVPEAKRDYASLEFQVAQSGIQPFRWQASYVLARANGNYPGLFNSDLGLNAPGNYNGLVLEQQGANSEGLLPNDRTHAIKVVASYGFDFGLTAGTFFTVQSGTPISAFAPDTLFAEEQVYVEQRGTVGRTPTLVDLDLRIAYRLPSWGIGQGRILVDVLNLFSNQRTVWVDQLKFLDPGQTVENPNYLQPVGLQTPAKFRVGLEIDLGKR